MPAWTPLVASSATAAIVVAVLMVSCLWPTALASAQGERLTVKNIAEAWYQTSPSDPCIAPTGCPPATTAYPPGTLHVGFGAGRESARTYVKPDMSSLTNAASLTAGFMIMPLSDDPKAGSMAADTATIDACLVAEPFADGGEGSFDTPPDIDCEVSASATYDGRSFTVNLAPLIASWERGAPRLGIALVPAAATPDAATWHVAFNGRGLSDAPHITTTFVFSEPPPISASPAANPSPVRMAPAATMDDRPVPTRAPLTQPVNTDVRSLAPAHDSPVNPQALGYPGFRYSAVFLLPLALVSGFFFFSSALTRDHYADMVARSESDRE